MMRLSILVVVGVLCLGMNAFLFAQTTSSWKSGTGVLYTDPSSTNVGIGITNPGYKLTVDGTIKAEELLVDNVVGADFVFKDDYKLRSLDELENYISNNKHLPDIPSATEMQKNGVAMKDLQMKLLQKVEELTLYVINLKKENQLQKQYVETLKERLANLENEKTQEN